MHTQSSTGVAGNHQKSLMEWSIRHRPDWIPVESGQ